MLGLVFATLWMAQDELASQAQELAMRKQYDQAIGLWQKALQQNPKHFPSLFNLGLTYFNLKRPADAVPVLERAAAVNPKDFNTRYLLGASYSQVNRVDDAIRAWRAARVIPSSHPRMLLELLIVEYGKGRYFNEAAEVAKQLLRDKAGEPNAYFLAIKAFQDAGDFDSGEAAAAEAVKRFPDLPRANFEHAFYLQKRGAMEDAIGYLRKAIALDSKYEEPPFFLGDLLVKQGKNEEALGFLRQSIACRADYIPARVLLSRALMNLERWEEAIAELRTTIEMDPKHPQPHLMLSQIYFRQGDEAKAKVERELSLRLRRENPTILEAAQGRPFKN
ncbi:hypothetical protein F183_A13690 [Bryobacterales bacterium F-183]|nr:hypothetical protein F183_A13690 [Bryobacterales bacterium F-183]